LKITITGRHIGVTDAMKAYGRAKAEKLGQYFERATHCRVTMDIDNLEHEVEMVLQVNRGVTLVGKAHAPDMYAACDLAEQKLAQQLRRHKERLTDHHRGARRPQVDLSRPAEAAAPEREATYEDVIEEMQHGD
jgi:putative sigma-54 modulation protein